MADSPLSIPGFESVALLGRGGMGEVWKARQQGIDRWVALKILHPHYSQDEEYVRRFQREARTVGKLWHENIVRAFDCGQAGDRNYLVMEFIEGEPLDAILQRRGKLPEREALAIIRAIAGGLAYAWEHRIIHRDIKPQNILVTPQGVPKLCDLGLSRDLSENTKLTQTGMIACTPAYASPEQAQGETGMDTRTDVYSLGIVLYQLVTGTLPFDNAAAAALLVKHVSEKPPPPVSRNRALTSGTNRLILDMLEKLPARRPPDMTAVVRRIDSLLSGGEEPAPKTAVLRPRTPGPRPTPQGASLVGIGAIAAVVVVLLVVTLSDSGSTAPPPSKPSPAREPVREAAPAPSPAPSPLPAPKPPEPKPPAPPVPRPVLPDPAEEARRKHEEELAKARRDLEAQARDATAKEEYGRAIRIWNDASRTNPDAETRIREIRTLAADRYAGLVEQASDANRKGEAATVDAIRKRILAWGLKDLSEGFERAVAVAAPVPPPPPVPPVPAPSRPKPPADARSLRDRVKSLYKADYALKTAEDARVLAAQLLEGARSTQDDAIRFAYLQEAREQAVRGGDPKLSFSAVDRIVLEYEVDPRKEWGDALRTAAAAVRDAGSAATLVGACLDRSRAAIAVDDYDLAAEFVKGAEAAAPRAGDAATVALVIQTGNDLKRARAAYRTAMPALEKLKTDPGHPAANLEAGRFFCFVKGDWTRGLPHLERGSDKPLREAAARERQADSDAVKLAAAADGWTKIAGGRDHAVDLFRQAWPRLTPDGKDAARDPFLRASALDGTVVEGRPAGWYIGPQSRAELYRLDRSRARSGRGSLRVESGGSEGWMSVGPFDTAQGREYDLSAWLLTERTEAWNLCSVYFYTEAKGRILSGVHLVAPPDQPWWSLARTRCKAPAGATVLMVMVTQGFAKGTAWVDDLSLRAIEGDKEFVVNGAFER